MLDQISSWLSSLVPRRAGRRTLGGAVVFANKSNVRVAILEHSHTATIGAPLDPDSNRREDKANQAQPFLAFSCHIPVCWCRRLRTNRRIELVMHFTTRVLFCIRVCELVKAGIADTAPLPGPEARFGAALSSWVESTNSPLQLMPFRCILRIA